MMEREWSGGRFLRLCQKELRETLRDRRTLATLLLMPILVYPLLSLALQRILLSGHPSKDTPAYIVGVSSKEDGDAVLDTIRAGIHWLQERPYQPIRVHRQAPSDASPVPVVGADRDVPRFEVDLIESDVSQALDDGVVDLLVSVVPLPEKRNRVVLQSSRFRVQYRQEDVRSEAALQQMQRLFQVLIDVDDAQRASRDGDESHAVVELLADPIASKKGKTSPIAAVIPLVLLLMTITGAVYPAIDLTAGERERGTMEALIASPVPRYMLLLSKYFAVLAVSMLTAIANLVSMWLTLSATGIGDMLLGKEGLQLVILFQIFPILFVFSCFFSAMLLALCSFARSFKEAQAYLIPVMLASLGPGVLSLMPSVTFSTGLAVVPLANVVLLSREILMRQVEVTSAVAAVLSTIAYAAAMLGLASKLFGMEASSHSNFTSIWDVFRVPQQIARFPDASQLAWFLAWFYPIYFLGTNWMYQQTEWTIAYRMTVNATVTFMLFLVVPVLYTRRLHIRTSSTYLLRRPSRVLFSGAGCILVGCSLWIFATQLTLIGKHLGLAIDISQVEAAKTAKKELLNVPFWLTILTAAIIPAVSEEVFFRGFVMSSFHRLRVVWRIAAPGLLFGLFHVMTGSVLALEKFLPITLMGILLGWIAWRTGSLIPSITVHALNNGIAYWIVYNESWLNRYFDSEESLLLPWKLLVVGTVALSLGLFLIPPPPNSKGQALLDI